MSTNQQPPATSPRVNGALLERYVGHTVRLVGKVSNTSNGKATIEASDRRNVQVYMNDFNPYPSQFVEIIGRVNPDLSIQELGHVPAGANFGKFNLCEMVG